MNYTFQDLLGTLVAFSLFPFLLIFPGYVTGYVFDILSFKSRTAVVRLGIAALTSAAISPILFFLAYRLVSEFVAILVMWTFAFGFILIILRNRGVFLFAEEVRNNKPARIVILISLLWTILVTIFLIDLHFGNRLYFNIVSYDYSTRASVINAITRTGVPPLNPSYFVEGPQMLTQLYYFWYILCSLIDHLGGSLVDARTALFASIIWTGLILFCAVMLFSRIRNQTSSGQSAWQKALMGIGLLFVTGLDILPGSLFILIPNFLPGRVFEGDIEQWNNQITAWTGAVAWTPHHVIAMLACIFVWIVTAADRSESWSRRIGVSLIMGLALASAFGLSVWITLIFLVFWGIWFLIRLIRREPLANLWTMILPGIFMVLSLLPFLLDLLSDPTGGSAPGGFPLALSIRSFYPLEWIAINSPAWEQFIIYLLALPLNYFLELGFFLAAGILWLQNCRQVQLSKNPFARAEMLVFFTTIILVTFVRSTVIVNNDFGWRGWLLGQFILIFWGVDIIQFLRDKDTPTNIRVMQSSKTKGKVYKTLSILMIVGGITTVVEILFLRTWPLLIDTGIAGFPRVLSPDNRLGERTLAMRDAYIFIEDHTPASSIVQFDPRYTIDRPSGLYRTRGTAISYHSLYGVPERVYKPLIEEVGTMFDEQIEDWTTLDHACTEHDINILILRDLDPIWSNLAELESAKKPIYKNPFTALFECGDGLPSGILPP